MRFDSRSSCVKIRFLIHVEKFSTSAELNLGAVPSVMINPGLVALESFVEKLCFGKCKCCKFRLT